MQNGCGCKQWLQRKEAAIKNGCDKDGCGEKAAKQTAAMKNNGCHMCFRINACEKNAMGYYAAVKIAMGNNAVKENGCRTYYGKMAAAWQMAAYQTRLRTHGCCPKMATMAAVKLDNDSPPTKSVLDLLSGQLPVLDVQAKVFQETTHQRILTLNAPGYKRAGG